MDGGSVRERSPVGVEDELQKSSFTSLYRSQVLTGLCEVAISLSP